MKKRVHSKSLDQLVQKYKKDQEFTISYEERSFHLQIAHLIRDLRERAGLSQSEVAKKAKVSQPMIARLENGDHRRIPTMDTIYRVLVILGYQVVLGFKP